MSNEAVPAVPPRVISGFRLHRELHPPLPGASAGESLLATLMKQQGEQDPAASNVNALPGRRPQPANFLALSRLIMHNPYHSASIALKKHATVGLGFKLDSKIKDVLDPLTNSDITSVLGVVAEDFFCTGNGYLEVVRDGVGPDAKIVGLHALPADYVYIYEEGGGKWHYELVGLPVGFMGSSLGYRLPRFGDSERFYAGGSGGMRPSGTGEMIPQEGQSPTTMPLGTISEVIHFMQPTALNRHYGLPGWLSAVSSIELMQALDQREFDFFINRGVPEFLLFITGAKAGDEQWKALETAMQAHIGLGNAHKSMAMNLPEPEAKIVLEKLDIEGTDQGARFTNITDSLSLKIVSAHQVPPLLAGIQIPGKLAANNELPNAIRTFQILTIAPAQEIFENRLETTLGNPAKNGGLFKRQQKIEFNAITDVLDLLAMQALAGSKSPEAALGKQMTAGAAGAGGAAAQSPQQIETNAAETAIGRQIGTQLMKEESDE
jgi:PBSX family phage portal protein